MSRILTNNPQSPAAFDGAAVRADFFDGRFYFHGYTFAKRNRGPVSGLRSARLYFFRLGASDDASPSPVRVEPYLHFVTDKHFDSMQTHFAGEIREYASPPFKLHLKKSVGKRLIDDSMHNLKFSHICAG